MKNLSLQLFLFIFWLFSILTPKAGADILSCHNVFYPTEGKSDPYMQGSLDRALSYITQNMLISSDEPMYVFFRSEADRANNLKTRTLNKMYGRWYEAWAALTHFEGFHKSKNSESSHDPEFFMEKFKNFIMLNSGNYVSSYFGKSKDPLNRDLFNFFFDLMDRLDRLLIEDYKSEVGFFSKEQSTELFNELSITVEIFIDDPYVDIEFRRQLAKRFLGQNWVATRNSLLLVNGIWASDAEQVHPRFKNLTLEELSQQNNKLFKALIFSYDWTSDKNRIHEIAQYYLKDEGRSLYFSFEEIQTFSVSRSMSRSLEIPGKNPHTFLIHFLKYLEPLGVFVESLNKEQPHQISIGRYTQSGEKIVYFVKEQPFKELTQNELKQFALMLMAPGSKLD